MRMGKNMLKEEDVMDITIKKLTPELTEDYLHFFDVTHHSSGKEEHRCYCVCWASADSSIEDFSTASKRRSIAERYIKNNSLQGYLAYYGDTVVGWCNANSKKDCYESDSWKRFMKNIKKNDRKIKSVFCFAIAPEFRGKGIASMLLKRVCEDAEKEGYEYLEAYPNTNYVDTEHDFMGPLTMYEKLGFSLEYKAGSKSVMLKTLR